MQFKESQQFRQWWLVLILVVTALISMFQFSYHYTSAEGITKETTQYGIRVLSAAPALILLILMWLIRFETTVDETGVGYRFTIFNKNERRISWSQVASAYIRTYKPLKEYGGWGYRTSSKHGRAYNVSGNIGLQLVLKTGEQVLLGTNKRDELETYMNELYKKGIVVNGTANIADRY